MSNNFPTEAWFVRERGLTDAGDSYHEIQAGGPGIGQGYRGDEYLSVSGIMSREIALLIAAAPEMYEALRAVDNWEAPSCWKKVTAALQRARGDAITGMESPELDASEFVTDPEMSSEPKTQSPAIMLLKQDISHARKIREHVRYESKLEGLLQLASRVLLNGDKAERDDVAKQIQDLLDAGVDPAWKTFRTCLTCVSEFVFCVRRRIRTNDQARIYRRLGVKAPSVYRKAGSVVVSGRHHRSSDPGPC